MLSPQSQLVFDHLRQHGLRSLTQLLDIVNEPVASLRVRLGRLRMAGYVYRESTDGEVSYGAVSDIDLPAEASPKQTRHEDLVKAPDYDIMRAPVWKPPAATTYRSGALDFTRCPSIQHGRSVPFGNAQEASYG